MCRLDTVYRKKLQLYCSSQEHTGYNKIGKSSHSLSYMCQLDMKGMSKLPLDCMPLPDKLDSLWMPTTDCIVQRHRVRTQ